MEILRTSWRIDSRDRGVPKEYVAVGPRDRRGCRTSFSYDETQ